MHASHSMTKTPGMIGYEIADILRILKGGLAAYMQANFPDQKLQKLACPPALSWIHVSNPAVLAVIRKNMDDATTGLCKEAGAVMTEYSKLEGELWKYVNAGSRQQITYAFVADQELQFGCCEINDIRRIFQARVLAIAGYSASILMAMQQLFAAYTVLQVCPPDPCDLPGTPFPLPTGTPVGVAVDPVPGGPWAPGGTWRPGDTYTPGGTFAGEFPTHPHEQQTYADTAQTIEEIERKRREESERADHYERYARELEARLKHPGFEVRETEAEATERHDEQDYAALVRKMEDIDRQRQEEATRADTCEARLRELEAALQRREDEAQREAESDTAQESEQATQQSRTARRRTRR